MASRNSPSENLPWPGGVWGFGLAAGLASWRSGVDISVLKLMVAPTKSRRTEQLSPEGHGDDRSGTLPVSSSSPLDAAYWRAVNLKAQRPQSKCRGGRRG